MIEVQHLTKRYGPVTAVDDVSFRVDAGEILGFLGPNGAGKTTTMRVITGYMPATDGQAIVAGHDVFTEPLAAKRKIGYLPETPPLYPDMTVREYLTFVARLKIGKITAADCAMRVDHTMKKARVDEMADRHCGKLSKGYRQRVGLAQALIHDPEVLILDEPTAGLDPKQIIETRDLIKSLAGNHTIVLSTHILPEVAQTCTRVIIINKGRVVAEDTTENLTHQLKGAASLYVQVEGPEEAAAALGSAPLLRPAAARAAASQPRIVIVGAGAAGVRCAHKLWTHSGWTSTVYEWDDRAGGRIETLRGFFDNGQIAEKHGEFVSSEHASMLALAASFNLGLDDTLAYPGGIVNTYRFNGTRYTQAQLDADWQATYWSAFHTAVKTVTWPQTYNKITATGKSWDAMSVPEWIDAHLPGGTGTAFGGLCLQDVISEYGGDPAGQSALNLPFILGYDDSAGGKGYQPKNSPVLAGTDERWHITGGNDQVITGMLSQLPAGTVQYGQQLVAVVKNSDGTFTGTFSSGLSTTQVTADRFIFALPFSTLRNVDLSKAGLSALKMTAISELGYGTNGKIIVQVNGHPWVTDGYNGTFLTDNGANGGWEVNYQASNYSAPTGVLLAFPGGAQGSALQAKYGLTFGTDEGTAPAQMVTDYLGYFETILPGVTAAYNGKAYYNIGLLDQHLLGAWSYWRVGQYALFSGYEGVAEGNAHFCGEHTAQDFQGFMEGGVTSGERVAGEV